MLLAANFNVNVQEPQVSSCILQGVCAFCTRIFFLIVVSLGKILLVRYITGYRWRRGERWSCGWDPNPRSSVYMHAGQRTHYRGPMSILNKLSCTLWTLVASSGDVASPWNRQPTFSPPAQDNGDFFKKKS